MRNLIFGLCLLWLSQPALAESVEGLWWISHGDGAPLQVRLYPGGRAWSDYPSNNPGRWERQGDEVICRWADDWKERFTLTRGGWKKHGYGPCRPLDGPAQNVSKAYHVCPQPDGWFGP